MKLVLFDIDGTLLTSGKAGAEAMRITFAELYGIPDGLSGISMSGKTDPIIFEEAIAQNQLTADAAAFQIYHERYLTHLRQALSEPSRAQRLMPGVLEVLEGLASQPHIILGLLTGNSAPAAQLKLDVFDLWHYFQVGAYGGTDASDRNDLVPIAQARTRSELGCDIPASQIVVIGDTPRDIECAQVHQTCAIAVATGSYSREELVAHQPDHILDDLGDVPAVLRLLI